MMSVNSSLPMMAIPISKQLHYVMVNLCNEANRKTFLLDETFVSDETSTTAVYSILLAAVVPMHRISIVQCLHYVIMSIARSVGTKRLSSVIYRWQRCTAACLRQWLP